MKNKIFYTAFIACFLCISLTLSVGMVIFGRAKPGFNETLSAEPLIVDKNGNLNDSYLSDIAKFINDGFFLRQELISVNNKLTAVIFGTSGEESIILGKDGWLYYESTLNDYVGIDVMTEREVFMAVNNVRLMSEYCKANGIQFGFMIAPNKNSLYADNMPLLSETNTSLNANRIMAGFKEWGIGNVDLFGIFSTEPVLYYKTDSHWNVKGAALAADSINKLFGVESNYYNGDFSVIKNDYTGDLYSMVYPAFKGGEDEIVYNDKLEFSSTTSNIQPDSFIIKTESDKTNSILVYRDSFGNILYPFIADSYGKAEFSRDTVYYLTKDVDYCLIEIVERNLPWLIKNIPVFESQPVNIELPSTSGTGTVTVTRSKGSKAPQGYDLWKGTLPYDVDLDSKVYINCGDKTYEAILTENNGFAVYLPEDSEPQSVAFKLSGITLNLSAICLSDNTTESIQNNGSGEFDKVAFDKAKTFINKPVSELYKAIGNPSNAAYLPSCIGNGEDGTLFYNGFTVTTYKEGDSEVVKGVWAE